MNGSYSPGDTVLGNWKLQRLIGAGSYGKVYEAQREEFGTTYQAAIKIITIPQSESEITSAYAEGMDEQSVTAYFRNLVEDIVQEFVLMSKLKGNSNVVSYEDHTVVPHKDGVGWDIIIRMELLTPLLDRIREQSLACKDVIQLGIDICKALKLCQKLNIVHRDIKPENIFVSPLGDYKLGDFGIARTIEKTSGGLSKKGTYTYMAPEVYRGQPYNSTVDIYSLGIVMYRLLNENRAPFLPTYPAPITHADREEALARRMSGEDLPTPKNADGRLAKIVQKACAYQPAERYSSPIQMQQELEAIQYAKAEEAIIYPAGEEPPIRRTESIPISDPGPVAEGRTKFTSRPSVESTTYVDVEQTEKTESVFSAPGSDLGSGDAEHVRFASPNTERKQTSDKGRGIPSQKDVGNGFGETSPQTPIGENVLLGAAGAFLGSLLGVVMMIVLNQMGYITALSGAVMGSCALIGYQKLGGCLSKKGIVISALIIFAMTCLGNRVAWGISLWTSLGEFKSLGLMQCIVQEFPRMLETYPGLRDEYSSSLCMQCIFTALGATPVIVRSAKRHGEGEGNRPTRPQG